MRWTGNPSQAMGHHPEEVLFQLLERRGLPAGLEREQFLRPKLAHLAAPEEVTGMGEGVELLRRHVQAGSHILIYSDYDVDGIVSASVMRLFLQALGLDSVRHFISDRKTEGYGLTLAGLDRALGAGPRPDLFLALDCGTNSRAEVDKIRSAGMEVLVIDHHQLGETAGADALVNPQRGNRHHHLCTAGLVFKLCHAYLRADGGRERFDLRSVLDLVALATVADLVPLEGDNRIFVREGLRRLLQTAHPGLKRLTWLS